MEGYRRGDPDAVATLLRSYQNRIYAICYRMLRHEEDARDLAQESMLKIIEGLDSWDGRARLSTWIIRVTMNACISHLRKRKLRRHVSLDQQPMRTGPEQASFRPLQPADSGEPAADQHVQRRETRRLVLDALETLEPQMKAILVLRDMHNLDYQQIAEVIDSPLGTVKSRLFRAREALREAIESMQMKDPAHEPSNARP